MSVGYQTVGWNRQKKIYDAVLLGGIGGYLALFAGVSLALHPEATAETVLIRATGTAAFLLLHIVLAIGPLCRFAPVFLPLLYNRRHLGVTLAVLGSLHGGLALFQFHALGVVDPLTSLFAGDGLPGIPGLWPFQIFGFIALVILLLMAVTSHDFWLAQLTAPVWKRLHQSVYGAYALLVAHVVYGAAQGPDGGWLLIGTTCGALTLAGLHLAAGFGERHRDLRLRPSVDEWIDACAVADIPEKRARIVVVAGERVAVFKYDGRVSAISNVCQHQNGPLGEGRIIAGCVTCPWHGYQYLPASGASPAPFTEKVPTFRVQVRQGRVFVHRHPLPPGTPVTPASIS
jgi:methionine sulfoxide reductase heme-binding subunit